MVRNPWFPAGRGIAGSWPWWVLAISVLPALACVLDYPSDLDPEYPRVFRPVFNPLPPLAYRLAEPGGRLDQSAIWLSAGAIVLAVRGMLASHRDGRGMGLWPSAWALATAVFWHAAIPTPIPDGWHGMGWGSIADPLAPAVQRLILAGAAVGLAAVALLPLRNASFLPGGSETGGPSRGDVALLIAAFGLVDLGLAGFPRFEPAGYWPRWSLIWGLLAWDLGLIRAPASGRGRDLDPGSSRIGGRRWIGRASWATAWAAIAGAGLAVGWYHRPIDRFKAVVPGEIYIGARPTEAGLELAYRRHRFRTIIDLVPEDGPGRSPLRDDERRFARVHGIRYVADPGETRDPTPFLRQTIAMARKPDAWPILVHGRDGDDRLPTWVGIYRFVVQGRPLDSILREIEQHRGSRPKAAVILLYNRVLPALSPVRYADDPTASLLRRCAAGAEPTAMGGSRSP